MKKQVINRFLFVLAIALISITFALPPSLWGDNALGNKLSQFRVTLGLDLAGGTELDYRIDLSDAIAQNEDDDPSNDVSLDFISESVRDSLEQRINPAGVGEIIVKRAQEEDGQHVIIQMPPSSNVAKAKKDAEQDNRLEFFEEDLEKEARERAHIKEILDTVTPWSWEKRNDRTQSISSYLFY